jgi:integrase/recombinase XerD
MQKQKEIDFKELEKNRSYKLLARAVQNKITLTQYNYYLREFLRYSNLSSYDELCKSSKIQELMENWVTDLSDRGLKGSSIRSKLAAVELLLEMNRVVFFKKITHKLIPKDTGIVGGDVPFTTSDVKLMLESTTKLRTKAILHFLASTGIRPGALIDPVLRRKHLVEMEDDCLAIRVYDNSSEGYWAFLTPEAKKALNLYFDSRKLNGEIITDESPLFVNEKDRITNPEGHLVSASLKTIMRNVLKKSGVARTKNGKRFDKATMYAFRKRFNGILKMNNAINSNIAEKLMAHKRGLDGSYLKPTREECFAEFRKAIPQLIISNDERNKLTIKNIQTEKDKALEDSQRKANEWEDKFNDVYKRLMALERENMREK